MKVVTNFSAMILKAIATPSRDGKDTYYKLSLEDTISGEAGTVKCTEDVAKSVERFKQYNCTAEFNDNYNPPTFRIVRVSEIPSQPRK